jgi:hypothetical protein
MSQDEKNKSYTKILLKKLLEYRMYIDYDLIEDSFYSVLNDEDKFSTTEEIIEFSEGFIRDLNLITSQIEKEEETKGHDSKKYVINGFQLTRDYYSIRTDAPRIIGESAQTLNSRVNSGIIKCMPEFKTKKVSAQELYNYYLNYIRQ